VLPEDKDSADLPRDFQFLANSLPQLIWVTAPNGDHLYFNQRWYEFTGLSLEASRDWGWSYVLHPEDYARSLAVWQHSLDTGQPYQIEYRFRRADGTYRWFLGQALPQRDTQGQIVKWYGTGTEIEDQKRFQIELKESRQRELVALAESERQINRLESLFRKAPALICIHDGPDLVYELVNPGYQALFPGRQLLGKPLREALPEIVDQPIWSIIQQVYQTGVTYQGKGLLIPIAPSPGAPLEDRYWDFTYQARRNSQGEIDGMLVFSYDVTGLVLARKRAEMSESALLALNQKLESQVASRTRELLRSQVRLEKERNELQSLFEQAPVGITILEGEQYVVRLANPTVLQMWTRRQEEVIGKPLFEALPELQHQGVEELLRGVRTSGEPYVGQELPVELERYGKRETVFFNFVYQPVRDEKGEIQRIVVIATQVNELVQARQLAEARASQLQTLNEKLSRVNGEIGAAHEELQASYEELQANNEELSRVRLALQELNQQLEERVIQRTEQLYQARQQAEKQQRDIYQLFMQAPAGIALLKGPDLVYQMANQTYYQILGRSSQILGKPGREAFPEGVAQGIWDLLDEVYARGEPYVGNDFPALIDLEGTGNLTQQYYDFVFQPVLEAGQVEGILITALNVTAQVQARQAIHAKEAYFREMADTVPVMIWVTDQDGSCTYLNKTYYAYTGQTKEEAQGMGWLLATHPDDFPRCREVFLSALANQTPFSLLYRLRGKDHTYRWMLDKGEPKFGPAGQFEGHVGTVIDVHEQHRAEQRLSLSVKAGRVGIFEWDTVHDRATYSDLLQEIFGLGIGSLPEEFENAYQLFQSLIHPEDRSEVNALVARALQNQHEGFYVEYRIHKPGGEIAWIAERGEIFLERGEAVRMNGTCIDITARKQAELQTQRMAEDLVAANEELRAANEEIQAANEEMSESNRQLARINADLDNFVYAASHDLKAPISNIEGLLKALEKRLRTQGLSWQTIESIYALLYESINRFKTTIGDLTEVARIGKESQEDVSAISVEQILDEVLKDLAPQIQEARATIEVKLDSPEVQFSRKNLKSVLYNLLSNAIKYRSWERPLRIGLTSRLEPGYYVLLVTDNGLGMDMRQEGKIFALFKRLHSHVEGTGIGLYMVKKMLENAGGKIEVTSRVDLGSTFSVYFKR
jgi:PAS domain S-box-containing protein